jgi:leucyl/phenylalanyl-tRNA--protein transferase
VRTPQITWISAADPPESFPDIERAFTVPDGLLAAGGDLSEERLLHAYRRGIFPWFSEGQPILWWSPDPRCVIFPARLHVSRRLRRSLRRSDFEIRFNSAFDEVIENCARDRTGQDGTWITPEMNAAYRRMHAGGWAHSIETWRDGQLVGGIYGLAVGKVFFGESMFSAETNASKASMQALCTLLVEHDFRLLDCQVESPHLISLGAELVPRRQFAGILDEACEPPERFDAWPKTSLNVRQLLA